MLEPRVRMEVSSTDWVPQLLRAMQATVQALLLPVAQPLVHMNGGLMLMLHAWLLLLLWQTPSGAVPSVGAECVQEKNKLDQRRDEVHPHQQASLPHDSNVHSTVLRYKAAEEKRNGKDLSKQDAHATPRQPVPDPFQNTRERALLPRKKRIASKQFLFQLSLTRSTHMAHA